MFNVFTDFHHAGLLHSLILLFEKRLLGNVYRPIGMEWAEQGFWKVFDHPATQAQYLNIGGATPDGTAKLNELVKRPHVNKDLRAVEGLYYCQDIDSGYYNKAITLSTFYHLPIDIVIASLPQHIEPFKKLCELHPNKPKLIYQIGNQWNNEVLEVKNIMASAKVDFSATPINYVSYHQEFDLELFSPSIPIENNWAPSNAIFSFVNCFNILGHFSLDWELFTKVEKLMPHWHFKSYGGQCRDGSCDGGQEVADSMHESRFIWHTKNGGDGYGHIIHNAGAVARPLIVKKEYYIGKMAEPLLKDGETCICIDNLNPQEIVNKILYYDQPERYRLLCKNAYDNFKTIVNFDKEEEQIKNFLANLQ